jgi:hypothetical protein
MSVILVDLGDEGHAVMVNNAGWRHTVEELRPLGILDGERLQRLETAWACERITQEEAQAIGNALVTGPLAAINWISNVFPPPEYWTPGYWRDALSGKHRDNDQETIWPGWLRSFAGFCLTCKGFIGY